MISASTMSFQQWSSKSRAMGGLLSCLFVPHIAAEIVVGGDVGRIALHARRPVVAGRRHLLQERALVGPGGLRLGGAIAPRHGVVEPAVRGVAVDVDAVALAIA